MPSGKRRTNRESAICHDCTGSPSGAAAIMAVT